MKTAVIVISDPKPGTEEALARFRNALALARDSRAAGDTVEISFAGTGTRWPAVASQLGHPANAQFNDVRDLVHGASRSCAMLYGADKSASGVGVELVSENSRGDNRGGLSIRRYLADGWNVVVF
jgi:hypothetical protein